MADLLRELAQTHRVPEELIELALELDKAHIPTRYPNAHPAGPPRTRYTRADARRLTGAAGAIVEFCARLLSQIQ